jgi:hypothetical protein
MPKINPRAKPKETVVQAPAAALFTLETSPFKVGGIYTCNDGRNARIDSIEVIDGKTFFRGKVTYHDEAILTPDGKTAWPFFRYWTMHGHYAGGTFLAFPDGKPDSVSSLIVPAEFEILSAKQVFAYWKQGTKVKYKSKALHEQGAGNWMEFPSYITAKQVFKETHKLDEYLLNYENLYVFKKA